MLTSGGESGWEWRPTDTPVHRLTAALTWQIPVGRGRAFGTDWNAAVDTVLGGWQYTASGRYYSGRPVFFNTSYVVSGNPKLELADPRSLVRHQHVRGAGFVHAAEQPVHL